MRFTVEVIGADYYDGAVQDLLRRVPEATIKGLYEIGLLVQGAAQRSIMEHQSEGREYKSGGRVFTASLPGHPPNSQHGGAGMVGSIQNEVDEEDLSVWIGTNLDYAAALEFDDGTRLARPWLFPAVESSADEIEQILTREVGVALG